MSLGRFAWEKSHREKTLYSYTKSQTEKKGEQDTIIFSLYAKALKSCFKAIGKYSSQQMN